MKLEDISTTKSEIKQARELIKVHKDFGLVLSGPFEHFGAAVDFYLSHLQKQVNFSTSIKGAPIQTDLDNILHFQRLRQNHKYITDDLGNILTILLRMNWMKNSVRMGTCPNNLWREFTSLDVHFFFVEFRSIFDYIAQLIAEIADSPKETKNWGKSFHGLSKKVSPKNPNYEANEKKLGTKQTELVRKGKWHSEIKEVRENLTHRGSEAIIFGSAEDPILFQLYSGPPHAAVNVPPMFMWDGKSIIDFELFSSYYLAKLLLFLEEFGDYLYSKVPISKPFDKISKSSVSAHGGLPTLVMYLDKLSKRLKGT